MKSLRSKKLRRIRRRQCQCCSLRGGFVPLDKPRFFEKQESSLCGQHALNNIFRNYNGPIPAYFTNIDTVSDYTESYFNVGTNIFSLDKFCDIVFNQLKEISQSSPEIWLEQSCKVNGDYTSDVLINAIKTFPQFYVQPLRAFQNDDEPKNIVLNQEAYDLLVLAMEQPNLVGILLHRGLSEGRGEHYTGIVRFSRGFTEIDSLKPKSVYNYYSISNMINYLKMKYIFKRMERYPDESFQMFPIAIYLN